MILEAPRTGKPNFHASRFNRSVSDGAWHAARLSGGETAVRGRLVGQGIAAHVKLDGLIIFSGLARVPVRRRTRPACGPSSRTLFAQWSSSTGFRNQSENLRRKVRQQHDNEATEQNE